MAKFKVGDKVRVKKDLVVYRDYDGGCCFVGGMANYNGEFGTITEVFDNKGEDRYHIKFNTIQNWTWSNSMLELVEYTQFTKADLKDGMVVEVRNNTRNPRYMVLNGKLRGTLEYMDLMSFNDDLTHIGDYERLDIVKVYESGSDVLDEYFHDGYLTLLWEREEEPEFTEMTVAEIEEKLGYKIKVIADKE